MQSHSVRGVRFATVIRFAVCMVVTAFLLVGCGGVKGVYAHTENDPGGEPVTISIELKSGDVAVLAMKGGMASTTVEGTYSVNGDKVSLTFEGDTEVLTLADGGLKGEVFGENVVLKKQ
jgi:hypothetical protein